MMRTRLIASALLAAWIGAVPAWAALPKPALTPAQQEAAAAKKAAADAQAAKAKEQLATSMDALSARWRAQAGAKGWKIHPPVAIAAAPAAGVPAAGPAATAPTAGMPLSGAVPAAVQTTGVAVAGRPMPGVSPRATGVSANTLTGTPAGNAAASPGGGAAPRSPQALQSANVPVKSEKLGTASPSADVKKQPTGSMPQGASPSVDRGNSKEVKN